MTNWSDLVFPESGKTSYSVNSSRKEGEEFLGQLAQVSLQEYAWQYDESLHIWSHEPTKHTMRTRKFLGVGKVLDRIMEVEVAPNQHNPSGEMSSFYHIHPRSIGDGMRETNPIIIPVKSQLPSSVDIGNCIFMTQRGYQDTRIVTELGVTVIKYNATIASPNGEDIILPPFTYPNDAVARLAEVYGVHDTIKEIMAALNELYEEKVTVEYMEF